MNGLIPYEPKYAVGDILLIEKTGALFLVEEIRSYEYCFRILDLNITRRDSIFYIDMNTQIKKVA